MELENGDIVKFTCSNIPMCMHFGIVYIVDNELFVMHNTPPEGTQITHWRDMLNGRDFLGSEKSIISGETSDQLLRRFQSATGKYDTVLYNCEDFIEKMQAKNFPIQQNHAAFTVLGMGVLGCGLWILN